MDSCATYWAESLVTGESHKKGFFLKTFILYWGIVDIWASLMAHGRNTSWNQDCREKDQ